MLKAARMAHSCITNLGPRDWWGWTKPHSISFDRHMAGKCGALATPREQHERDNEAVRIPSIWCLGGRDVRTRYQQKFSASTVVFVVLGDTVGNRVSRCGMRLVGRRHKAKLYEEERPGPDAFCCRCCVWGHIGPHCIAAAPRCSFCEEEHMTADHWDPVDRCRAKKGC